VNWRTVVNRPGSLPDQLNMARCVFPTLLRRRRPFRGDATRLNAFTLVEILIVVVIIAILAAIVIPQHFGVQNEAIDTSVKRQLRIVRTQLELYRIDHGGNDPDMSDWQDLVQGRYLRVPPDNPANGATAIGAAGDFSGGWVWRDDGSGNRNQVYATNLDHSGEYPE
jgi:prepilin-type N-terminal cleavage/methylation domain-containing protein